MKPIVARVLALSFIASWIGGISSWIRAMLNRQPGVSFWSQFTEDGKRYIKWGYVWCTIGMVVILLFVLLGHGH